MALHLVILTVGLAGLVITLEGLFKLACMAGLGRLLNSMGGR